MVLADFQSIKDAFESDAFMGRPSNLPFELSETSLSKYLNISLIYHNTFENNLYSMLILKLTKT